MKQDYLHTPIFITGIERSGSYVIARILQLCGAWTGDVNVMCENTYIKKFVDFYYKANKWDVRGQSPLPNLKDIPISWQSFIKDIIIEKGAYNNEQPWMYKSSRIAQIWPVWNNAFPNAKYIIVRRRTGDIISSCLKTGFMNAYNDNAGWLYWIHEHEKLFVQMIEKGLNCKIIWPERMVNGDFQQMIETLEWVGLHWNPGILRLVEPLIISNQKERSK